MKKFLWHPAVRLPIVLTVWFALALLVLWVAYVVILAFLIDCGM